jgi:hypothetical protein
VATRGHPVPIVDQLWNRRHPRRTTAFSQWRWPGIEFGPEGEITLGDRFREIEAARIAGIAAMARAGALRFIELARTAGGAIEEQDECDNFSQRSRRIRSR